MAKICFFGGTFDPIHNGHIELAMKAVKQFSFDSFFFMPTGGSYMKDHTTSADLRYKMTEIALSDYDVFNVTDIESKKSGPSYTFETLSELNDLYPEDELYFLMGEDSIRYIDKWKHPEIIFEKAVIIVARRLGNEYKDSDNRDLNAVIDELTNKYKARISIMDFDNPISSTFVRGLFMEGRLEEVSKLVNSNLYQYIIDNKIYL